MKSYSNSKGATRAWFRESFLLFLQLKRGEFNRNAHLKCLEYASILQEFSTRKLSDANVLEIGFGAKPFQLACLIQHTNSARGIDADIPILPGSGNIHKIKILTSNGFKRFLRSSVRYLFYDKRIYKANDILGILSSDKFHKILHQYIFGSGKKWPINLAEIDFIYSEDVFEHIPPELINAGLNDLANNISSECLVFIRPNIFTGITGGHDPEFYNPSTLIFGETKWRPWEHLYPETKFETSTYLNKLKFNDYVNLFSSRFKIIKVYFSTEKLGEQFDTSEIIHFTNISRDDLFYNQVGFLLKKL